MHTEKQADRAELVTSKTGRQECRQTEKQTEKQTNKNADRQRIRPKERLTDQLSVQIIMPSNDITKEKNEFLLNKVLGQKLPSLSNNEGR